MYFNYLGQLVEVARPELLAVLEPGERGLRDADHLALQAHVAVLPQRHLQVLQELGCLYEWMD